MKKALIAMSGGVDSSVAAWLMKRNGYDCAGAMMQLYTGSGCCPDESSRDAREVAERLSMPFYMFDFTDSFENHVISRFTSGYLSGATPNPCIDCNRYLKFGQFLNKAGEIGYDFMATGHYARIEKQGGRYLLKKGLDNSKDQSYVLYSMTQKQLAHTQLPLGGLTKRQVREIAEEQGFINANKRESQDICFVPDGDYPGFIERYTGTKPKPGRFLDTQGRDMGEHRGIIRYTVGQRKGLGISASVPLYVCAVCADSNTVIVGGSDQLFSRTLTARNINIIPADRLDGAVRLSAKIRYTHSEQPVTVCQTGEDTLRVEFDQSQRAITKGQAVVLYDGDVVVGGGTISHTFD